MSDQTDALGGRLPLADPAALNPAQLAEPTAPTTSTAETTVKPPTSSAASSTTTSLA